MTKATAISKFLSATPKKRPIPNVSKGKPFGYGKGGKYNA